MRYVAAACLVMALTTSVEAQNLDQPCNITALTFAFENNSVLRTVQQLSGPGCTASFRGGLNSSFDSISVVKRAQHLSVAPTSNGFGFSVSKRNASFRGQDSYTLKICGQNNGRRGCVTITYDVSVT